MVNVASACYNRYQMNAIITPESLYDLLKSKNSVTLIDIRPPSEFATWSLYDGINIPLKDIDHKASKLPKSHPIVVFGEDTKDAKTAAERLIKRGFNAQALEGGLKAWNNIYDIATVLDKRSTLTVYQVKRLGKGCLSYMVVLPDKVSTIIVDPAQHINMYIDHIKKHSLKPIAVLDTHVHADHISGARLLAKKFHIPYLLPKETKVSFSFEQMEKLLPKLATDATVSIIPTPGHTPEGVALLLDDTFLLSGDTLFIDAIGRSDSGTKATDTTKQFYASLSTLMRLPENIQVLPAHTAQPMMPGAARSANMRYIILFNPLKDMRTAEAFVEFQQENATPIPSNFEHIVAINMGKKSAPKNTDDLEFGPNSCALNLPEEE